MYNVNILSDCLALSFAANPKKKLIEFGWDEPDTTFMREHIVEMEKTSFNGCVFHLNYKNDQLEILRGNVGDRIGLLRNSLKMRLMT